MRRGIIALVFFLFLFYPDEASGGGSVEEAGSWAREKTDSPVSSPCVQVQEVDRLTLWPGEVYGVCRETN